MSRFLFITSVILVALAGLLVAGMNPVRVEIELAFVRLASPVGLAIVISFALGLVTGLAWYGYWVAELLNERGRLRRALRIAQAQERAAAVAGEHAG